MNIDFVDILTGDAGPWLRYFTSMGFRETGRLSVPGDRRTIVLMADAGPLPTVSVTVPCQASAAAAHLAFYGPGLRGIGLEVDDLEAVYRASVAAGGEPVQAPMWRFDHAEAPGGLRASGMAMITFGPLQFTLLASRMVRSAG